MSLPGAAEFLSSFGDTALKASEYPAAVQHYTRAACLWADAGNHEESAQAWRRVAAAADRAADAQDAKREVANG